MPSKFEILNHVLPRIADYFQSRPELVFTQPILENILDEERYGWALTKNTALNDFAAFLGRKGILTTVSVASDQKERILYARNKAEQRDVALALRPRQYFSHLSAMFEHGLTDDIPGQLFLNQERHPPGNGIEGLREIPQERIDHAFAKQKRRSQERWEGRWKGNLRCLLLTSTNLDGAGITDNITSIERTLLDITVRPDYAGGPKSVMEAYRRALGNASINRLQSLCRKSNFVYPIHQAIGFYLERSGAAANIVETMFGRFEQIRDFHLANQMGQTEFCDRWRIHYPVGIGDGR